MQHQDERNQPCSLDITLYDRYAAGIFAYIKLHTPSWQDAEDLTLEVFLTALEHDNLSWLTDKQQLVWLRRVAHNRLIDKYRRSPRPVVVPLDQVAETVYHDEALTPEQLAIRREELERLYKAVGKLSLLEQQGIISIFWGEKGMLARGGMQKETNKRKTLQVGGDRCWLTGRGNLRTTCPRSSEASIARSFLDEGGEAGEGVGLSDAVMKIVEDIDPKLVSRRNQCLESIPSPNPLFGACLQTDVAFADALSGP